MKNIGMIVPADRENAVQAAIRAAELIHGAGAKVYVYPELLEVLPGTKQLQADTHLDAVLTLGGDGTLLRGAEMAALNHLPVLGVNLGHTGFLTEIEQDDMEEAIRAMIAGKYEIESRTLLRVQKENGEACLAVNDVAITRGHGRLIRIAMYVNGEYAGDYRGDGLVVATPTGSTGYSLSAGGPILAPGVHGMVITPICAHSMQHRPVVVAGRAEIELVISSEEKVFAYLQVDGRTECELYSGDRVYITRPPEKLDLIRLKPLQFFTIVREKLIEWSR